MSKFMLLHPLRTCLSLSLTLGTHNTATSTNTSCSPEHDCNLSVLLWQSILVQVCTVDIIYTHFFVKVLCIMCAGVHSGYKNSAWRLSLLGEKDAFFDADVLSKFHPAFKAVLRGRKMNRQCFATSFQRSHWEWASVCVCPGVKWGTVNWELKSMKWFFFFFFPGIIPFSPLLNP